MRGAVPPRARVWSRSLTRMPPSHVVDRKPRWRRWKWHASARTPWPSAGTANVGGSVRPVDPAGTEPRPKVPLAAYRCVPALPRWHRPRCRSPNRPPLSYRDQLRPGLRRCRSPTHYRPPHHRREREQRCERSAHYFRGRTVCPPLTGAGRGRKGLARLGVIRASGSPVPRSPAAPEEPAMRGAVSVAGVPGRVGAFHRFTGLPARHRVRVDQARDLAP